MKKVSSLLLILLILLIGCATTQQTSDLMGSEGLYMKVGTLPKTVYAGQSTQIPVYLENKGASKVENGILVLSGYDNNILRFSPQPIVENINLEGKNNFISVGERTTKIFKISAVNMPEIKSKDEIFQAIACYQYKTEASPVVCINPSVSKEILEPGSCDPQIVKLSPTQGAPVAVTKVYETPNDNQIYFEIFVKNLGPSSSRVIAKESYSKPCIGEESSLPEESDSVMIEAYLGSDQLICYDAFTNEETNTFEIQGNDMPSVLCIANIDKTVQAYTTPLSIHLSYGYVISETITLNLLNPEYSTIPAELR